MKPFQRKPLGVLLLENGEIFGGISVGASGTRCAEVVFNTSMSGYQEILTDPSYYDQIVAMTYPEIGNYGVSQKEAESDSVQPSGFIVRRLQKFAYNDTRGDRNSLEEYLIKNNIVALQDIDTRRLTKTLRSKGVMRAIISDEDISIDQLRKTMEKATPYDEIDMISKVSCKTPYDFQADEKIDPYKSHRLNIGVIDYGVKRSILRILSEKSAKVRVYPSKTPLETLLNDSINGVVLSNGPGNPEVYVKEIEQVKRMIGKIPIFGICLGHQILSLASGYSTYKLPFGHRGANHPIKTKGRVKLDITSQNHGYAVKGAVKQSDISHVNLNDDTVAGYTDEKRYCSAVQYHPEGAPGPHDSFYLFEEFLNRAAAFVKSQP